METADRHLQVVWCPIERVIPYTRNARVCPEAAIAKVAGSIAEFGWKQPIVVDSGFVIVAGHTRLLAAQRLGLDQVPIVVADDLSPAQVKAYRLADNRTSQETSWDEEMLAIELEELGGLDIDLALTGFDEDELEELLGAPAGGGGGLTGEDEAPEPPETPATRAGDLWLLGPHRLLCGDSTKPEDVLRLMAGERARLMATDPPYLVDYDGGNHPPTVGNGGKWAPGMGNPSKWKAQDATKHWDAYTDQENAVEFYRDFLSLAIEEALAERVAVYQWFAVMRTDIVLESWRQAGLLAHQVLIWKKSRSVLTHCDYLWDYEPFIYGWVQGKRPKAKPPSDGRTTWEIDSTIEDNPGSIHPTMKPVELIRRPVEYHTKPGDVIYEPFSGSGTALIAAESTGRRCYAMELSPAFVDAAVARWEAYTGQEATLEGDGRTFSAVSGERLA